MTALLFSIADYLLSIFLFCFSIKYAETIAVKPSAAGAAIQTPFIPQIAGKRSRNVRRSTIPLKAEMTAELNASPQLVKYMEFVTSYPMIKKVTEQNRNPVAAIFSTLLLHPKRPAYLLPRIQKHTANNVPTPNKILFVILRKSIAVFHPYA